MTWFLLSGQRTSRFGVDISNRNRGIACLAALSETHQILQKTCRDFANAELAPLARQHDREQLYPAEQVRRLGELGLMSVAVQEEYGEPSLWEVASLNNLSNNESFQVVPVWTTWLMPSAWRKLLVVMLLFPL